MLLGLLSVIPTANIDTITYVRAIVIMFCISIFLRFPPQISLIFRMRSTKGWSMELVYTQIIGALFLLCKIIFDGVSSDSKIFLLKI